MAFAECSACAVGVRVCDGDAGGVAADAAVLDAARRFRCPSCGVEQRLPCEGVYVVYDRVERRVAFVGRSVDVPRRLAWWKRDGSRYGGDRYRRVQLVARTAFPDEEWFAAGDELEAR